MNTLSLTFRGPFLCVVPPPTNGIPSPFVTIYAPPCDDHSGSVFFGDAALPLYGRMRLGGKFPYTLTGPVPNSGKISYQWNYKLSPKQNPLVTPETHDGGDSHPTDPTVLSSAYLSIQVPRPKIFYALNLIPDTELVKTGDCCNDFSMWATGFRFYYDWQPGVDIYLDTPKVPPDCAFTHNLVTPPTGARQGDPQGWLPLTNDGDIEFQFEGSGGDDLEHRDAMRCFAQIAQLAKLDWWLNFRNGELNGGGAIHSGGDCLATPVVIGIKN